MSMSIRCDGCGLEYAGARAGGKASPRPSSLCAARYLLMLAEIMRFYRRARALMAGDSVRRRPGRRQHARRIPGPGALQPLLRLPLHDAGGERSVVLRPETALAYPARYLFTFLGHHGLLGVKGSPQWRTVTGGSGQLCGEAGRRAPGHPARQPCHGRPPPRPRRRGRRRRRGPKTSTPWSSPRTPPRRSASWPSRPRPKRKLLGRMPLLGQPHRVPPRPAVLPRSGQRPGVVELPAARLRRPAGQGPGQLRPHPAPAPQPADGGRTS